MADYLSIGKVSKIKNVSIKSLRYYDEIGIFQPAYINPKTNYRYYTRSQLPLLDAISLCIEIGIPLKEFTSYKDAHGNIDLHKLLCDGKILAEEKIRAMGARLETLSRTIEDLEKQTDTSFLPTRYLALRNVLALPFDKDTTSDHYTHLILQLFVQAQQTGLNASYPSGFLFQQTGHTTMRYVFVELHDVPVLNHVLPEPFTMFTLHAGNYYCVQSRSHQIEQAVEIFRHVPYADGNCLFIETDLLKANNVNKFELQLLQPE